MLGVVLFGRTSHERLYRLLTRPLPIPPRVFFALFLPHRFRRRKFTWRRTRRDVAKLALPGSICARECGCSSIGESSPHADRRFPIPHSHVSATRTRRCSYDWAAWYAVRRSRPPIKIVGAASVKFPSIERMNCAAAQHMGDDLQSSEESVSSS
jgi:hypothetical protein